MARTEDLAATECPGTGFFFPKTYYCGPVDRRRSWQAGSPGSSSRESFERTRPRATRNSRVSWDATTMQNATQAPAVAPASPPPRPPSRPAEAKAAHPSAAEPARYSSTTGLHGRHTSSNSSSGCSPELPAAADAVIALSSLYRSSTSTTATHATPVLPETPVAYAYALVLKPDASCTPGKLTGLDLSSTWCSEGPTTMPRGLGFAGLAECTTESGHATTHMSFDSAVLGSSADGLPQQQLAAGLSLYQPQQSLTAHTELATYGAHPCACSTDGAATDDGMLSMMSLQQQLQDRQPARMSISSDNGSMHAAAHASASYSAHQQQQLYQQQDAGSSCSGMLLPPAVCGTVAAAAAMAEQESALAAIDQELAQLFQLRDQVIASTVAAAAAELANSVASMAVCVSPAAAHGMCMAADCCCGSESLFHTCSSNRQLVAQSAAALGPCAADFGMVAADYLQQLALGAEAAMLLQQQQMGMYEAWDEFTY